MNDERSEQFRAGVGAIITNAEHQVLGFQRSGPSGAWQVPQGGINEGESFDTALWRELSEETGLSPNDLALIGYYPAWLGYTLPRTAVSEKTGIGQVHRWFVLRARHPDLATTIDFSATQRELSACRWMDWDELITHAVPFRQSVYRLLAAIDRQPMLMEITTEADS